MLSNTSQFPSYSINNLYNTSPNKDGLFGSYLEPALPLDASSSSLTPPTTWLNLPSNPLVYPTMPPMMYGVLNPLSLSSISSISTPNINPTTGRLYHSSRNHTEPLFDWMKKHSKDPYPTKKEKEQLAKTCGMTARQIEHWFANARRRQKKMNNYKKVCSASGNNELSLSTSSDPNESSYTCSESSVSPQPSVVDISKDLQTTITEKPVKRIWSIASSFE